MTPVHDLTPSRAQLSMAERAAESLEALVKSAEPGARLGSKEELRAWCDVSMGTFNESLRLAQVRGFIHLRRGPGGGIFAAEPSAMTRLGMSILSLHDGENTMGEAFRIRAALDVLLVEDAVRHASPDVVGKLREEVAHMYRAAEQADRALYAGADLRFHSVLCAASPNAMLRSIYTGLLDYIEGHPPTSPPPPDADRRIGQRARAHEVVVDAIAAGDPGAARTAMEKHNAQLWVTRTGTGEAAR